MADPLLFRLPRFNRRFIVTFDWVLLGLVILVAAIGILTIYSATRSLSGGAQLTYHIRQSGWLGFSVVGLLLTVAMDYRWLQRFAYALYGLGLVLLLVVLVKGRMGMGAQRWLSLGVVAFQPSEIVKIFFILALSRYFAEVKRPFGMRDIIKVSALFLLAPLALLLLQPDLGTGLIFCFIFICMVLIVGVRRKVLIALILSMALAVPFLGSVFWSGLKPYQRNRILAFVQPQADPSGIGYQINQSKITIGSGALLGKGYLKGTQGTLRFLPEKHTDFIFSIFAEEWGFVGAVALLMLFLLVLVRGLETAQMAKDRFGYFVSMGVVAMFALYICINLAMTLGLAPVVGVPLPFMSYGGTALVTNFVAVGLLVNIRMRRFQLFY